MAGLGGSSGEDERRFNPRADLTDVALYSYTGLCAYALGQLYEGSLCDRQLVERWIATIIKHNGQGETSQETMQAMARAEVRLDDADPFVESLRLDPYIAQHGPKAVVQDLMELVLADGCYDSRMRTLLKYMSLVLRLDWETLEQYENALVESLQEEEHTPTAEEVAEKEKQGKKRKIKRYALISVAALGGGALLGLTGGLAAPLIAAGAGAVIGGAGATALASTAGVAIIGSLFGVAGLGLGGYKMKNRVGGVEEFMFEPLSEGRQLHVTIAVSGWLTDQMPEFKTAWLGLANSKEQYVLKYESKYLLQMGKALDYLVSIAITAATQEALKYTILSGILTAIAWPATLLSAASVIDNPWSVCTHRAVNVGRQLADVLLSRQQGKRPVTLIGFSLGARVIFYCLQEMAKRKNCEGIIEDVILLGAPITGNPKEWQPLARVVAGKIVNGYCKGDWLLKFLYRTASIQFSIAGLKAVAWEDRRMHNIDLSDVVEGHIDYLMKIDEILSVVGVKTREHAARQTPDSLRAWVQIQKSTSLHDRLAASNSETNLQRLSKDRQATRGRSEMTTGAEATAAGDELTEASKDDMSRGDVEGTRVKGKTVPGNSANGDVRDFVAMNSVNSSEEARECDKAVGDQDLGGLGRESTVNNSPVESDTGILLLGPGDTSTLASEHSTVIQNSVGSRNFGEDSAHSESLQESYESDKSQITEVLKNVSSLEKSSSNSGTWADYHRLVNITEEELFEESGGATGDYDDLVMKYEDDLLIVDCVKTQEDVTPPQTISPRIQSNNINMHLRSLTLEPDSQSDSPDYNTKAWSGAEPLAHSINPPSSSPSESGVVQIESTMPAEVQSMELPLTLAPCEISSDLGSEKLGTIDSESREKMSTDEVSMDGVSKDGLSIDRVSVDNFSVIEGPVEGVSGDEFSQNEVSVEGVTHGEEGPDVWDTNPEHFPDTVTTPDSGIACDDLPH